MIRKTLLFFLALAVVYITWLRLLPPAHQVAQHQWEENQIKAQNYLYRQKKNVENVIVGSSLSCRMNMDSLAGFTNLALNGQSIFDGLAIVSRMDELPDRVFIEMNVVTREGSKTFTDNLFNPVLYHLRKNVPSLRDGYQPLALAGEPLSRLVKAVISSGKGRLTKKAAEDRPAEQPTLNVSVSVPTSDAPTARLASPLFLHLIEIQIGNYSKRPDLAVIESSLNRLAGYVRLLRSRHVQVCFFEMPVDEHLCGLPLAMAIRQGFFKTFPPDRYTYIHCPDCAGYQTSDGLHLKDEDALRYTLYFRSHLPVL